MSEQDEQRPLTRRERRLREMAETGALDLSEMSETTASTTEPEPATSTAEGEIEISPFNDDGTPRSRREMRQLREQALAERAVPPEAEPAGEAEPAANAEPAGEPEPERTAEAQDVSEPEQVVEPEPEAVRDERATEPVEATPLDGEPDFDSLIAPPTEPFTVAELQEAERGSDEGEPADTSEGFEESAVAASASEDAADEPEAVPEPKQKRRFWQRGKDTEERGAAAEDAAAEEPPATAPEAEPVEEVPAGPSAPADAPARAEEAARSDSEQEPVEEAVETVVIAEVPPVPAAEAAEPASEVEVEPASEAESAPEPPESPEQKTSYSFPDIAPPEEWRSVFDDPDSRTVPDQSGKPAGGDFDELISRAVAQEGSTGGAGGAALILPSMPEDSGGLAGPLGSTGELYVTGSLKLPKSLGETGGHAALHDSIEMDPITGAEPDDAQTAGQGPAPVSARHAVSARATAGPVVAKPAKERSKLPLVLSLTGGGLLIAVVALGVWGASNGMFG
ncbi:hypothetical protein [Leucobacter sp. wl10]|uniref:hypothetical protein n=1 Tax=Leucobacter sp. wl10 TaxID=2304677 RepID=UPI000E5AA6F0|nr:hypothetical protein [Leucobacter sp. wl10]RGE22484.1 hypothetical protein D1J51_04550 [Leucobacter sp. wl10]